MNNADQTGGDVSSIRFLGDTEVQIGQLLYPRAMAREDACAMGRLLALVEAQCAANAENIRVVVTGGGFLEIPPGDGHPPPHRSLEGVLQMASDAVTSLTQSLGHVRRDYIVGIDVFADASTVGQFAAIIRQQGEPLVVWKSFPVQGEARYLAGFGTPQGRCSPRIVQTAVGTSLVLVCHDAQAFNHRQQALVGRGTGRGLAMDEMQRQMHEYRPTWAFNLIHRINKPGDLRTFSRSYQQIHDDHDWSPCVVGSFGYGQGVGPDLARLAAQAQYPRGLACGIAVE